MTLADQQECLVSEMRSCWQLCSWNIGGAGNVQPSIVGWRADVDEQTTLDLCSRVHIAGAVRDRDVAGHLRAMRFVFLFRRARLR